MDQRETFRLINDVACMQAICCFNFRIWVSIRSKALYDFYRYPLGTPGVGDAICLHIHAEPALCRITGASGIGNLILRRHGIHIQVFEKMS